MSLGTFQSRSFRRRWNSQEISKFSPFFRRNFNKTSSKTSSKLTSQSQGFICHNESHWFSIRKIHGYWINLNSTCKKFPQVISDFYLAAFLDSIMQNGYIIFQVQGEFQTYDPTFFDLQPNQKFLVLADVVAHHQKEVSKPNYRLNSGGDDEEMLQKILDQSKKEFLEQQQKQKPQQLPKQEEKPQ